MSFSWCFPAKNKVANYNQSYRENEGLNHHIVGEGNSYIYNPGQEGHNFNSDNIF